MSAELNLSTINPAAIRAIIIVDDAGNERRIECEPLPCEGCLIQVMLGERISSERVFWTADDAQREYEGLLVAARRKGRLSTVSTHP